VRRQQQLWEELFTQLAQRRLKAGPVAAVHTHATRQRRQRRQRRPTPSWPCRFHCGKRHGLVLSPVAGLLRLSGRFSVLKPGKGLSEPARPEIVTPEIPEVMPSSLWGHRGQRVTGHGSADSSLASEDRVEPHYRSTRLGNFSHWWGSSD
jgi:hypothetical protein